MMVSDRNEAMMETMKTTLGETLPSKKYFTELMEDVRELKDEQKRKFEALEKQIEELKSTLKKKKPAHARTPATNEKGERQIQTDPEETRRNEDDKSFEAYYRRIVNQRRFPAQAAKCKFDYVNKNICSAEEDIICHLVGGDLKNSAGAAKDLANKFGHPSKRQEKMQIGEIYTQTAQGKNIWHLVS